MDLALKSPQAMHRRVERKKDPQKAASDEEVLAALERGDRRAAVALLLTAHGRSIHRYCQRILRSPSLADDVCQSVFIQAFEDLGSFAGRSALRSWLHSIARHRCLDATKARRRSSRCLVFSDEPVDHAIDPDPSSEERLAERSMAEALDQCLEELAPRVRDAILLRYREGLTYEEIARVSGERPTTLQARVARALPSLRRGLEARGMTL